MASRERWRRRECLVCCPPAAEIATPNDAVVAKRAAGCGLSGADARERQMRCAAVIGAEQPALLAASADPSGDAGAERRPTALFNFRNEKNSAANERQKMGHVK